MFRGERSSRPCADGNRGPSAGDCGVLGPAFRTVLGGLLTAALTAPAQAQVPNGFVEEIALSGLNQPTAVRFSPDGRVFVAEKSGLIKVFSGLDDTTPTVFADLRQKVHNYWDRGMIGLALDPAFPTAPWVYVLYTHDAAVGETAPTWNDGCPSPPGPNNLGCVASGRLSRLEAAGDVMTGGEQVLIEDWCIQYVTHSVGTLAFGPDGALYVSGGEGAAFTFVDYGQRGNPCGDPPLEGGALRAQDIRTTGDPVTLHGTVLRVNPVDGTALPDNPLYGGAVTDDDRILAYGLRNPFRMTFHPTRGEIWVGDVGRGRAEEINRIVDPLDSVVENFGWPCFEGFSPQSGFDAADLPLCESLYGTGLETMPYYAFIHGDPVAGTCTSGASAISGLAFYEGGSYPAYYQDALFFSDYSRRCIWVMFAGPDGLPDVTSLTTFLHGSTRPVDLQIGPGGDLFYVDIQSGTVRRFEYFTGNQPPVALAASDVTAGPSPLTVSFDASGSSDPDPGDVLLYSWDLDGDGLLDDSTDVAPAYVYGQSGIYSVTLEVLDPGGLTDRDTLLISVDDSPPVATILAPAAGFTWRVGEEIPFAGQGIDPETGLLPDSALSWSVVLHHCDGLDPFDCHEHYLEDYPGVGAGSTFAPDHEFPSHLELHLTATEVGGGGWWDPGWARRRMLGLDNLGQAEALVGFPVLVRLDPGRIDYGRTLPGGADLRFVDGDGTPLAYEIEAWDPLGESLVWVRVPVVDAATDADFVWMYHGNDAAVDAQDPAGVWGFDHAAVWHLGDLADSSGNDNHASAVGTGAAFGQIGGARSFDGVDDFLDAGTSPSLELVGAATFEAWVQVANPNLNRAARIFSKKLQWYSGAGYGLEYNAGRNRLTLLGSGNDVARASSVNLDSGWHHLAAVIEGGQSRLYVDGVDRTTNGTQSPLAASSQPLRIGRMSGGGNLFGGTIDELRISGVARSADWIAAQHLSMTDGFVVFGAEESAGGASGTDTLLLYPETVITTMESDPPGLHLDFYQDLEPAPFAREAIVGGSLTISAPSPQFLGGDEYEFVSWSDGGAQSHDITLGDQPETFVATFQLVDTPPPPTGWWNAGWALRRGIELDGGGLAGDLTDVPVLVALDASRVDYGAVQDAGEDLRFVAADDTTVLAHTIESWDEAGTSLVWVDVPLVTAGAPLDLWMYYGNPVAPDGQDPAGVWGGDFAGVWHLGPGLLDATPNGNHASASGTVAAGGAIGQGRLFDGQDDYLSAGTSAAFDLTGALTLEAWVALADPDANGTRRILSKKVNTSGGGGYSLLYHARNDKLTLVGSGGNYGRAVGLALDAGWHYLAAVIEGSSARLYADGLEVTTDGTVSPLATNNVPLQLGRRANRNFGYFAGALDEVRVSGVARSTDWIAFQYRAMTDALLVFGPAEPQS